MRPLLQQFYRYLSISIFLSNYALLPQVELLATALTRGVAAELLAIALTRARSDTLATALTEADPKLLTVALTQVTQHSTAQLRMLSVLRL